VGHLFTIKESPSEGEQKVTFSGLADPENGHLSRGSVQILLALSMGGDFLDDVFHE